MKTLSAYLLDRGVVDASEIDRALQRQVLLGGDLGSHLLGTAALDEPALLGVLSDYHGLPAGPAGRLPPLGPELRQLLPIDVARRYDVFPIGMAPRELHVAAEHPLAPAVASELAERVGRKIWQVVVCPIRLREAWWRHAAQPLAVALRDTLEVLDGARAVEEGPGMAGRRKPGGAPARSTSAYRRMVEAEQRILPADRSSSVSLLSAMVASRLGAADVEEDPLVECTDGEPFEEVELSDEFGDADFASEPPDWELPSLPPQSLPPPGPGAEAELSDGTSANGERALAAPVAGGGAPVLVGSSVRAVRAEVEGPDTEREGPGGGAVEADGDAGERASAAREREPSPGVEVDGPERPMLVEWSEVAGLVELGQDLPAIHGELRRATGIDADEPRDFDELDEPVTRVTSVEASPSSRQHAPGRAARSVSDEPERVADSPERVADLPERVAEAVEPVVVASDDAVDATAVPVSGRLEPVGAGGAAELGEDGADEPVAASPPAAEPSGESSWAEADSLASTDTDSLEAASDETDAAPLSATLPFRFRGPFPRAAAEVALETAGTVNQVLDVFMRFARQYFDRTVLWTVRAGRASVRHSYGMPGELAGAGLDLSVPSLLKRAHDAAQIVVDVPTGRGFDLQLRTELGLGAGVSVVVVPIRVRQRVVALLHADDVGTDVDRDAVAEVAGYANLVGNALAALIVRRKRRGAR